MRDHVPLERQIVRLTRSLLRTKTESQKPIIKSDPKTIYSRSQFMLTMLTNEP